MRRRSQVRSHEARSCRYASIVDPATRSSGDDKKCCPSSPTPIGASIEPPPSAHVARVDRSHRAVRTGDGATNDRLVGPSSDPACIAATNVRILLLLDVVAIRNAGPFPRFPITQHPAAARASFDQRGYSIDFTEHWTISSCACEHRGHCTFSVPMLGLPRRRVCDRILFVVWLRGKVPQVRARHLLAQTRPRPLCNASASIADKHALHPATKVGEALRPGGG